MSTPNKTSLPAADGLSSAQKLYYDQLVSGGQRGQETLDYVRNLNDLQSLASLANTQGKFADIAQGSAAEQIQDLESLYQAPIISYLGDQTRTSTFRPIQSAADSVIPPTPIVETAPIIKSNDTGMTARPLYTSLTSSSTPAQIAAAYAQLTAGAGGDTAANQTEAVAYLQKLGVPDATIMAGYNQYLSPLSQVTQSDNTGTGALGTVTGTGTGTVTGALDIANMAGLGTTGIGVNTATGLKVDDEVAETFQTVFGRAPSGDELTALRDKYGYTIEPGELNQIVLSKRDANVGYGVATTQAVTPVYGVKEIIDENGELVQVNTITGYKDQNGNTVDPSLVRSEEVYDLDGRPQTVYNTAVEPPTFSGEGGTINKLTNQILGQGTTQYWSGEGYGSAKNSAADMALILASSGITDIKELGVRDKVVKTEDQYDENGFISSYGTTYTVPEYYNKTNGQAIESTYDKAQGNTFGGTFAGEGSTAYNVRFQPDGTPVFYTQYGGSSNDLAQVLEDPIIGSIVQAAASYFGGPIGTAALNLLAGRDVDDVAKAALTSYVAGQVGNFVSGAESVVDTLGQTGANIAGKVAGSVASGGGKEGAFQALITGGVDLALPEVTNLIPGYENLSSTQKSFVNNIVSSTLRDGDLSTSDIINAAVTSGKEAVRTAVNDKLGETAFVESKRTGASDDEAFDASKTLTAMAEANETFDGSALGSQKEAMDAAIADGKDKFTFGGKTFTIDNSAGKIADLEKTVKDEADLRGKTTAEWGDLAGAQADATARNTVTIGNAEANDLTEAAALAKVRDPSASNFTFGGKTYTMTASNAVMDDAVRADKLDLIQNNPNFNAAYAAARELLGPGQEFPWFNPKTGKVESFSTATAKERPDLNITSADKAIEALNTANLATTTDASKTVGAQTDTTARIYGSGPDQSAAETTRLANLNAGLSASATKTQVDAAKTAINSVLGDGFASDLVTQGLSNIHQVVGQTMGFFGGTASAIGLAGPNNTLTQAGDAADQAGKGLQIESINQANSNVIGAVQKADGFIPKVVAGAKAIIENPLSANMAAIEVLQEALPIGVAAKVYGLAGKFAAIATDVGLNAIESGGSAYNERYSADIKAGKTPEQAESNATKSFWVASAVTAVTGGITDMALVNKITKTLDDAASKAVTRPVSTGAVSAAKEAPSEMAEVFATGVLTALAQGETPDINKILTQTVVEGYVGGKTAGSIDAGNSAIDAVSGDVNASTSTANGAVANVDTTAADNVANNINTAITSGNTQNIGGVITENVTTSINSGASANAVVDSAVTTAVTGGANAAVAVDSAITSAISSGASVDTTIGSAVSSAVKAGADVNTVIQAATTAAASTGNNVTITSDANVVTVSNATANTSTTVDTKTGVTTTVDNNTNTTTTVNGNTTTTVDTNANTNTQTTVNTNTNTTTSTTVNTNTNATTQTTTTGNTQTTILTDPTTNTQTTVKINTETGDVEDVKEVEIPADWTPPVINTPEVKPPTVTTTPPTVEVTPDKTSKPKTSGKQGGAGGAGLPLGIGVDPASLRSKVTGDAIDPLARVKQAQAELERDVMMNQMDPRFLAAIQQRTNPNQQAQQLDSDVGALAKMLRGESDAPANESKYYSYGAEDSIDDILGGKAANYAAGGYVEPLKASGGSMALPLLAKSGGALSKYNGREDFKGGKHVAGEGDGQSDDIPAWLADGEFVFPADVVSALGNGSTKAGTDKLYEMMHGIRDRARSKGPKDLPPPALKSPLDYLKSSKRSPK